MSLKPYYAVRISSSWHEKHGKSIETAFDNFCKMHGMVGKVTRLKDSSSQYEGMLILFTGSNDFIIEKLEELVSSSNRIPGHGDDRPKIILTPVTYDQLVGPDSDDDEDDSFNVMFDLTDDSLNEDNITKNGSDIQRLNQAHIAKVESLETTISDLESHNLDMQDIINHKTNQIDLLTQRIQQLEFDLEVAREQVVELDVLEFDNFDDALRYVVETSPVVKSVANDAAALDIDLDMFVGLNLADITFIDYVNKRSGTNLTKEDYVDLLKKYRGKESWRETSEGKFLLAKQERYRKNQLSYDKLKSDSDISKDILEVAGELVRQNKSENVINQIQSFSKQVTAVFRFDEFRAGYGVFRRVFSRSMKRHKSESKLPILVDFYRTSDIPHLKVTVPNFGSNSPFNQRVSDVLASSVPSNLAGYRLKKANYVSNSVEFSYVLDLEHSKGIALKGYKTILMNLTSALDNDPYFTAFGVTPDFRVVRQ